MKKNFTIYRLAILNKAKEEQILSYFNGTEDLFNITHNFYKFLSKNKVDYYDNNGNKRTFSVDNNINYSEENRTLISDLDSAYTGESFDIRNGDTNGIVYSVSENELQSRQMFSLIFIPINSKYGYVVFENKSKHGVKKIFEKEFKKFLNENGYDGYRVKMTPGLNFNYLSNMIEKGKLKKLRLINYKYSGAVQLKLWGKVDINSTGEETTELKFRNKTENKMFKDELYELFFSKLKHDEKVIFVNQYEIDEISFEINHNNSSKTFYLKDRSKMRSNIDVTKRLDYVGEEPTKASKIRVSLQIISEILNYGSSGFNEVA